MTTSPTPGKVHHGRNIKRLREMLGIKQESLAITLGDDWSQHKVSRLEDKEVVEDEILQEVGKALHVSAEAIKQFDEQAAINIISNTFHDFHDNATASAMNYQCSFNPLDKIVELYERMIKDRDELIGKLEKILDRRV
ncbi:XRE family transcriptional regulator [Segetibacter sp. 3557_3]|uniref:helix-turn-helix transcriptional regulator n=1 Tax=Segetibacter sp. 3557_3 TaxID=2547429 RepID=UPI0010586C72|nr:helix-turn-helix transcriptional regulator [Segetibacter sp. 3557_3]TDH23961.1 XRE family transcriptional regulator [Segetibacter sp. 3557_3]